MLPFINHVWTTCRQVPVSDVRKAFLMNVSSTSQHLGTRRNLVFKTQKS